MPDSINWNNEFNISPTSTNKVGNTPEFIKDTRAGVQERLVKEHSFDLDNPSTGFHGEHLQGSARVLVSETEPEDASVLTDDGEFTAGRLRYKSTTKELFIKLVSGWVTLLKGGLDALLTSLMVSGPISAGGQITSTVATGTAPLVIASTTRVANLNVANAGYADSAGAASVATSANSVSGYGISTSHTANTLLLRDASGRASIAYPTSQFHVANLGAVQLVSPRVVVYSQSSSVNHTTGNLFAASGKTDHIYYKNTGGDEESLTITLSDTDGAARYSVVIKWEVYNNLNNKISEGIIAEANKATGSTFSISVPGGNSYGVMLCSMYKT